MLRLLSSSSISLSLKRYNNKLSLLKCFSVNSSINHNINILNDDDNDDVKVQKLLAHWPLDHRQRINDMIRLIGEDSNYENIAKGKFISPSNWLQYITASRRKLVKEPKLVFNDNKSLLIFYDLLERVKQEEIDGDTSKNVKKMNLKRYLGKVLMMGSEKDLAEEIASFKTLCTFSDLRLPHEWYPYARLRKRKVYFHGGPTNSGKTYHALQSLRNADTSKGGGIYCGPLRLLALEVYESLNRQGIYTNLLTGQEKREVDFATHIACTLEMVNITKEYDVAVIDEIQMITDQQRGSAWTRALQGLMAREIHVCGGLEALSVVQSLVESCGDDFELVKYERLSKLVVSDESLRGDYSKVRPGDCIVAFSRSDIFSIKRQIERLTDYKCAVVYGQLPPETRTMQARLFNEENTGYDILVASDAIGMGLNLNIRRIIFHTVIKRGKHGKQWIEPSGVKQIGGRAGRKSSNYKIGEVTTWQDVDLAYVKAVMSWEIPQIPSAGIFPSIDQIELFSEHLKKSIDSVEVDNDKRLEAEDDDFLSQIMDAINNDEKYDASPSPLPSSSSSSSTMIPTSSLPVQKGSIKYDNIRLSKVIDKFVELAQINGRYFLCDHVDLLTVANWLHPIPMTLSDKFQFSNAPVAIRDHLAMQLLYKFAATYALGRPVGLNVVLNRSVPRDLLEFTELCAKYNSLELYLWLSLRFPKYFIERDTCLEQKNYALDIIQKTLTSSKLVQQYSHSYAYRVSREDSARSLPPIEYGEHILKSTKENLDKMTNKHLMQFPTQQDEDEGLAFGKDSFKPEPKYTKKFEKVSEKDKPWQKQKIQTNLNDEEKILASI